MDTTTNPGFKFLRNASLILLASTLLISARAEVTNTPAAAEAKASEAEAGPQDSLRSYLQIQEQLHNTQASIEKYRQAAEDAAANNSQVLNDRLSAMEKTLASQQLEELKGRERSERLILVASGIFAGVGFVVLLAAAFLQLTAVNRLAAAATNFAARAQAPLGLGEAQLMPAGALQQSTASFLGIIERLEQRIHDLESTTKPAASLLENSSVSGASSKPVASEVPAGEVTPQPARDKSGEVNLLIGKVQTLFKLDKPEQALAVLDELLGLDPGNADALVKKGAALERLQRFDEAIQCYDRAIAQDHSLTMAYLYKGGVFNRLERYSEALACYEQALKTRQNGHAANVIMD